LWHLVKEIFFLLSTYKKARSTRLALLDVQLKIVAKVSQIGTSTNAVFVSLRYMILAIS